jgi:hypothetical protein
VELGRCHEQWNVFKEVRREREIDLGPILQSSISAQKTFRIIFVLDFLINFNLKTTYFSMSERSGQKYLILRYFEA